MKCRRRKTGIKSGDSPLPRDQYRGRLPAACTVSGIKAVVKQYLESLVEPCFHPDWYGYRPGKSALDAIGVTRKRCWRYDGVVNLDIKGFFDHLDHRLVMRGVEKHTNRRWILLYVERWLKHRYRRMTARSNRAAGVRHKAGSSAPYSRLGGPREQSRLLPDAGLLYPFQLSSRRCQSPHDSYSRYRPRFPPHRFWCD